MLQRFHLLIGDEIDPVFLSDIEQDLLNRQVVHLNGHLVFQQLGHPAPLAVGVEQEAFLGDFFAIRFRHIWCGLDHFQRITQILPGRQASILAFLPQLLERGIHAGLLRVDAADAILNCLLAQKDFLCGHPFPDALQRGVLGMLLQQQPDLGLGFLPLAFFREAENKIEFLVIRSIVRHPIVEAECFLVALGRTAPGHRDHRQSKCPHGQALGQALKFHVSLLLFQIRHAAAA